MIGEPAQFIGDRAVFRREGDARRRGDVAQRDQLLSIAGRARGVVGGVVAQPDRVVAPRRAVRKGQRKSLAALQNVRLVLHSRLRGEPSTSSTFSASGAKSTSHVSHREGVGSRRLGLTEHRRPGREACHGCEPRSRSLGTARRSSSGDGLHPDGARRATGLVCPRGPALRVRGFICPTDAEVASVTLPCWTPRLTFRATQICNCFATNRSILPHGLLSKGRRGPR